jgi:protocatechuate 3,4-dioxygenase beta subunit
VSSVPPLLFERYASTIRRAPAQPLLDLPATLSELTGPGPALADITADDVDLTSNASADGVAIGERIIVTGRILDAHLRPVRRAVVEIWQANAAGRYAHEQDDHDAPLDPNFIGAGWCITDEEGSYRFTTIKPGAYPWRNHPNAWRPAHIHFSIFGPSYTSRLVTQMYFPGDPLQALDPIMHSVPEASRSRLIARYDHEITQEEWALGYRFDIVLGGPRATPPDPDDE